MSDKKKVFDGEHPHIKVGSVSWIQEVYQLFPKVFDFIPVHRIGKHSMGHKGQQRNAVAKRRTMRTIARASRRMNRRRAA